MKLTRWLCLLLACVMLVLPLCSCNDDDGGLQDGGDRVNGSWDGVDFNGETVKMAISTHQRTECTFPAADIYTRGPDDQSTTEGAQQKVIARNERVCNDLLNIKIDYMEKKLNWNEVAEDIRKLVLGPASAAPDIYNNDINGLISGVVPGYYWNVKNPGDDVKSYFDFDADGWFYEYMMGTTFNQNKVYLLAGDYFIDLIRQAWVVYVNVDMLNANAKALGFEDIEEFYDYVDAGDWDYDMLRKMCNAVWIDNGNNKTDSGDTRIGFITAKSVGKWVFCSSSGVTYSAYQDENGTPKLMTGTDEYKRLSDAYRSCILSDAGSAAGVYVQDKPLDCTTEFMKGKYLFAFSSLGELGSEAMRATEFTKGLVPVPKYDARRQLEYHTMAHDQTELGVILNNASSFAKASALMQAMNEESGAVIEEYYENGLKFRFSEGDKATRKMIDLVYETIDSPFIFLAGGSLMSSVYTASSSDVDWEAAFYSGSIASAYQSSKDHIKAAFDSTVAFFNSNQLK